MALFLFDIDGTLVRMGGAGSRAMAKVFEQRYGVADAFSTVDFRGNLDPRIVRSAMQQAGIDATPAEIGRFRQAFVRALEREVDPSRDSRQQLCPGVPAALAALSKRGAIGLVTGNWEEGARIKLGAFGLWSSFEAGPKAFGDDGEERADLVGVAIDRAKALGCYSKPVLMLGDTPNDVRSAKAAYATSVALLTGWDHASDLRAANPDLVLENLESGLEALLALA
jgi:phosphoglycolate phosphatase